MLFWVGILVAAGCAWYAVKIGFYEIWAIFFNLAVSVFLSIFLRSTITDIVPAASEGPYGDAITLVAIAVGAFAILQGVTYVFLTSQFKFSFPKAIDILGAGVLGFLGGFLLWSFACLLICVTPIAANSTVKSIGLETQFEQSGKPALCRCGNFINWFAASDSDMSSTQIIIDSLLKQAKARTAPNPVKTAEPNDVNEATELLDDFPQ